MLSESAGNARQAASKAFWWRFTDNLFRRLGWFLLPIVLMTMLGVYQASNTAQLFQSTGTLSAATNPLVPNPAIDGINPQFWESPAQATSRSLNERLGTEVFLNGIIKAAGLDQAVASGFIDPGVVRQSIWSTANGESILAVHAQWGNPQTSYDLAKATITQFESFLKSTASSRADASEQYYSAQLTALKEQRDEAQRALTEFADGLESLDASQSTAVEAVQLDQLKSELQDVQDKITAAEDKVDEARLLRTQETSEASQSISVIDAPKVPTAPQSSVMKRIMLVMSFALLGGIMTFAALLVTTVLDHTVSSTSDLLAIDGISLVATVPPVRIGQSNGRRRSRMAKRKQRPKAAMSGGV